MSYLSSKFLELLQKQDTQNLRLDGTTALPLCSMTRDTGTLPASALRNGLECLAGPSNTTPACLTAVLLMRAPAPVASAELCWLLPGGEDARRGAFLDPLSG